MECIHTHTQCPLKLCLWKDLLEEGQWRASCFAFHVLMQCARCNYLFVADLPLFGQADAAGIFPEGIFQPKKITLYKYTEINRFLAGSVSGLSVYLAVSLAIVIIACQSPSCLGT